jgi:hypothetical protein
MCINTLQKGAKDDDDDDDDDDDNNNNNNNNNIVIILHTEIYNCLSALALLIQSECQQCVSCLTAGHLDTSDLAKCY